MALAQRTTDLDTLTSADIRNDRLYIVDVSDTTMDATGTSKQISPGDLAASIGILNVKNYGAVGDGVTDDTAAILAAEAARSSGSTLLFPQGDTFKFTGTLSPSKPGTWLMQGVTLNGSVSGHISIATSNFTLDGGQSVFNFTPGAAASSLNRAVRVAGALSNESPGYGVTGTIAIGALSFTADDAGEAATLANGDWIIVVHHDVTNWVRVEHKQVLSVSGTTINVTTPFAQAFNADYTIEYLKVTTLRENVKVRDLRVNISDTSQDNVGFDGQPGVVNSELSGCTFNVAQGLALSVYGWANPNVLFNTIVRQQGRNSAWSSNTGGLFFGNKFLEGVAQSTAGCLTVETGTFGTRFLGNSFFGGNAGSTNVFHNNANGCTYDDNIFVRSASGICLLVFGSSYNKIGGGNVFIGATEGITVQKDTAPTPDMNSDDNIIAWPTFKGCTTAVRIVDTDCNRNVVEISTDTTITTALNDAGTLTRKRTFSSTFGAYSFGTGINVGNAANSNANVLDWYEEGTWTPVLTFATAGDQSIAYSVQSANFTRRGNRVSWGLHITTSTFTHTTASGNLRVTGLPYTPSGASQGMGGTMQGWTKANYTQVSPHTSSGNAYIEFLVGGSAQGLDFLDTADMPTGGTVQMRMSGEYVV